MEDPHDAINVLYGMHVPEKTNQLFITLGGENTKLLLKNDSTICYHFNFKNLSIKYSVDSDNDIYCKTQEDIRGDVPLELLLLKRNKSIYLGIMASKDTNTALPDGLLYNFMITGESIK